MIKLQAGCLQLRRNSRKVQLRGQEDLGDVEDGDHFIKARVHSVKNSKKI